MGGKLLGLYTEEIDRALDFFDGLEERDEQNVHAVLRTLKSSFEDYSNLHDWNKNHVFLNCYLVGGCLTKEGERPDIDLLTVTNMWYPSAPVQESWKGFEMQGRDLIVERLHGLGGFFHKVDQKGELPNDYNLGVTKGKVLFELHPRNRGRKIDLIYLRNMSDPSHSFINEFSFSLEEEFEEIDVDISGMPLERRILMRL